MLNTGDPVVEFFLEFALVFDIENTHVFSENTQY